MVLPLVGSAAQLHASDAADITTLDPNLETSRMVLWVFMYVCIYTYIHIYIPSIPPLGMVDNVYICVCMHTHPHTLWECPQVVSGGGVRSSDGYLPTEH